MDDIAKDKLGFLIQYYRLRAKKNSSIHKYNKQEFIKDFITGEVICSVKTLYNIEHRLPVKNDDVYELLLRNLGLTYHSMPTYYGVIEQLEFYLYQGVLTKKKKYFLELEKYIKLNINMRDYVIYNEFYQCCEFIMNYELYHKYNLDFEHYLMISSICSKNMRFLMAYTIHQINCETIVDMNIFKQCDLIIRENHSDDQLFHYHNALLSLYIGEYKQSLDKFTQIYRTIQGQNYPEFKLSLVVMIARIEALLDLKYIVNNRIHDILIKIKQCDMTSNQLIETYITLGNLYYENEDYATSIQCFNKVEDIDPTCFPLYAPYYYNGKEKLGEPIVLRNIMVSKEYYPHYYPFAWYYSLKYSDYSNDYKLTYLVETILPRLKIAKMGNSLDKIFLNETIELAMKTRKYQMVVEYLSNFYK